MPKPPSTRSAEALRLAALVAAIAATFAGVLLLVGHDVETVREAVDATGAWAPVAFCVLVVLLSCAFFPFPVIAAAGGVLFGTAAGTGLAIVGGTLGALTAFGIARRFGAGPVAALAPERARRLLDAVSERGFAAVLLLRIAPGIPRDLVNYLCGITTIGVVPYGLATLIGISPRAYAYTALGGSLSDLTSPQAIVAVALLAAMGLLGVVLLARERRRGRA